MKISKFVFNMFGVNTYILWDEQSREAGIADPGMMSEAECQAIDRFLEKNRLTLTHLFNTHMHIDHVMGNEHIQRKYGLCSECNEADNYLAERVRQQAQMFGIPYNGSDLKVGRHLNENDAIRIGEETLRVLYVPGHTAGHIALHAPESSFVLSGDALFQMSIGRTDLPGGDFDTLIGSITDKLLQLPPDTIVYPGHGSETTVDFERKNNPYITIA